MVRITRVHTGTGDGGSTSMVDGTRVSKADPRMVAVGMVDGLNSMVGVCIMEVARLPSIHPDGGPMTHADRLKEHLLVKLRRRQHELFDLGAELACPASSVPEGMALLGEEESDRLLEEMESLLEDVPDLTSFILPTGPSPAAFLHMVRTLARDLERHLVTLREHHGFDVRPVILQYVNRLSDWAFVLARHTTLGLGGTESLWVPKSNREVGMPPGNDLDEVLEEVLDGQE